MINLLQNAAAANYRSGKLSETGVLTQVTTLPFNGSNGDPNGFTKLLTAVRTEDGRTYNAVQLHPKWTENGSISALFQPMLVPAHGMFTATVGYIQGAQDSDGVTFELWLTIAAGNRVRLLSFDKKYDGRMQNLEADLSAWAGKNVRIELVVNAGPTSSRDWAVWANPEIKAGSFSNNGRVWEFRPRTLRIPDSNEFKRIQGGGDEPYLGAIYFSSTLGKVGSSKVIVKDKLMQLGKNIPSGGQVGIPDNADLVVRDNCTEIQTVNNPSAGIKIMAYICLAMEEDKRGEGAVRKALQSKAEKLLVALRANFETANPRGGILDINNALNATLTALGGTPSGGGFGADIKKVFSDLFAKVMRADDMIGLNYMLVLSYSQPIYTTLLPFLRTHESTAVVQPIGPLAAHNYVLEFRGSDAQYKLDISFGPSAIDTINS